MIAKIAEFFSFPFVQRAFVSGIFISICAALLGVVLVLKHYSLIGHGLSDVSFASSSVALAIGVSPLLISTPAVIIASSLIMAYSQRRKINGDTALGTISAASLAFGVIVAAVSNGFNADVYNYMFGSILALNNFDAIMSVSLASTVILLFILFYNRIFLIVCDEDFARASGINVSAFQFLISILTALAVVIGMKIMGTLLISSLIIFPSVTSSNIARSFKSLVIFSSVVSVICFVLGIFLSFFSNLPAGASIVAVNAIFLATFALVKFVKNRSGV